MTTNRDKLNKMTNEELAEFLSTFDCCMCVYDKEVDCLSDVHKECFRGILQWLNQECEEDK